MPEEDLHLSDPVRSRAYGPPAPCRPSGAFAGNSRLHHRACHPGPPPPTHCAASPAVRLPAARTSGPPAGTVGVQAPAFPADLSNRPCLRDQTDRTDRTDRAGGASSTGGAGAPYGRMAARCPRRAVHRQPTRPSPSAGLGSSVRISRERRRRLTESACLAVGGNRCRFDAELVSALRASVSLWFKRERWHWALRVPQSRGAWATQPLDRPKFSGFSTILLGKVGPEE